VRLFRRQADGLRVTEEAAAVMERILDVARSVERVERDLLQLDPDQWDAVTLTVPSARVEALLMPGLAELLLAHPRISLHVLATNEYVSLGEEADIALRAQEEPPPDAWVARPLGWYAVAAYATPAYLQTRRPEDPVSDAGWIGGPDQDHGLELWRAAHGFPPTPIVGRFGDLSLQLEAARSGLGMACLPCYAGDGDRDLVRLPGTGPVRCQPIWLMTLPELARRTTVRLCLDHLAERVREIGPLLRGECPDGFPAPDAPGAAAAPSATRSP
jgi:DNA-binding transcriptional LysR family regulator